MKEKIRNFLINIWDKITYRLKYACERSTPKKRLLIVLVIGGILSIVSIYTLVSSIYSINKRDVEGEFMKLRHIKTLELQKQENSINILNQKEYDYEQQSNDQ